MLSFRTTPHSTLYTPYTDTDPTLHSLSTTHLLSVTSARAVLVDCCMCCVVFLYEHIPPLIIHDARLHLWKFGAQTLCCFRHRHHTSWKTFAPIINTIAVTQDTSFTYDPWPPSFKIQPTQQLITYMNTLLHTYASHLKPSRHQPTGSLLIQTQHWPWGDRLFWTGYFCPFKAV